MEARALIVDFEIRDFDAPRDAARFHALFEEVFELPRSDSAWSWRYEESPSGSACIAVAEAGQRLASVASVVPTRMTVAGEAAMGSQSIDVMTHPAFQGHGLYPKVALYLYGRLPARGVDMTFGFTNANSTEVTLGKLERKAVGSFPLRFRPLRPFSFVLQRLGKSLPPDPGPEQVRLDGIERVEDPERVDGAFDDLWERIRPSVDVAMVRDAAHLRWRYLEHPDAAYELLALRGGDQVEGYVAWRILDRFGTRNAFVADLAAPVDRPDVVRRLLRAVAARGAGRGATLLSLLSYPGDPTHVAALRFAWIPVPRWLFPQAITFSVRSHVKRFASQELARPERWWLTWGDSDVV